MQNDLITVQSICDALGRRRIADAIGVRLTSVSNAIVDGRFPARWFHVVDRLCAESELPCPHQLFTFVGAASALEPCPDTSTLNQEPSHDTSSAKTAPDAA